ncbi:MAG TPA: NADH-quinone oxidoreductase subunit B family protein [Egibacteraceae bacterium]|nr:NADH-quinone oxidoreductase subunit B family protein [Egibacteraceae bacterium]
MGLESRVPSGILLTNVEKFVNWSRAGSLWPATFGLACCAIEMMATGGAHYDLARFGMEVFRASPRQADLMIVAGRVSQKMAPVLRNLYDQMSDPKWVLSMGVCASSGGMFNNYAIVQGVDHVVPVDMYVPGCPPRPEMLMDGIVKLHEKIKKEQFVSRPRAGESMEDFRRRTGWSPEQAYAEGGLVTIGADASQIPGWAATRAPAKSHDVAEGGPGSSGQAPAS